jgi:argininosuccinate lyase
MLPEIRVNVDRMEEAARDPNLLATDLAEYLVKKGLPFREAHAAIGKLVAGAVKKGIGLGDVSLSELHKVSPLFGEDVKKILDVRASLAARTGIGAPSPDNVKAQIDKWRGKFEQM